MSLGLGLAFTKKSDTIRKVAIITESGSQESSIEKTPLDVFLNNNCKKNGDTTSIDWNYTYEIKDDKLGNSIFLFYYMKWDEGMILLKRGTINLLLSSSEDSVSYHFDPMNSDAELTYLKLSNAIGRNKVVQEIWQLRNKADDSYRNKVY